MGPADRPLRVLVVEDDVALAELTAEVLRDDGTEVAVAHSLDEVRAAGTHGVTSDLALLDINLGPGQPTGLEVYDWLAAHGFAGRLVFITGHATTNPLVREAAAVPMATLLSKPYDVGRLLELVQVPP
ncbi:MAG: response regulator [Deltaproteobacteria bacterium]|nr:response regulator [Deltaproteobacteria bacterium]